MPGIGVLGQAIQSALNLAQNLFQEGGPRSIAEIAGHLGEYGVTGSQALEIARNAAASALQTAGAFRAGDDVPVQAYYKWPGNMGPENNYMVNVALDEIDPQTGRVIDTHPFSITSSRPLTVAEWQQAIADAINEYNVNYGRQARMGTVIGTFRK